jgi:hypothetical protein
MSMILEAGDGRELKVNAWNWGVLHHFVAQRGVLPPEVWAPKRYGAGGELDAAQVAVVADCLERDILVLLKPGERMFFDGTVTAVPDDGTLYREPQEQWRNYSLQREVLVKVIAFLRAAGGPVAFC